MNELSEWPNVSLVGRRSSIVSLERDIENGYCAGPSEYPQLPTTVSHFFSTLHGFRIQSMCALYNLLMSVYADGKKKRLRWWTWHFLSDKTYTMEMVNRLEWAYLHEHCNQWQWHTRAPRSGLEPINTFISVLHANSAPVCVSAIKLAWGRCL